MKIINSSHKKRINSKRSTITFFSKKNSFLLLKEIVTLNHLQSTCVYQNSIHHLRLTCLTIIFTTTSRILYISTSIVSEVLPYVTCHATPIFNKENRKSSNNFCLIFTHNFRPATVAFYNIFKF